MAKVVNEGSLDERLAALEGAASWSPRLVSKLESHIRTADDKALFGSNTFGFAADRGLSEKEVVDLFLHATALGLFEMDWSLFCPQCCCVVDSFRNLKTVHNHYHCAFCQVGYEAALDEYIAVAFTVSADIRQIQFHNPDQLSAWDKFFKTQNASERLLPNGQCVVSANAAFARAVSYLPGGETTCMEVEAGAGTIVGSCPYGKAAITVRLVGDPVQTPQIIPVIYGDQLQSADVREMVPGKLIFALSNETAQRGMFVIAVLPAGFDIGGISVRFAPFLNGKRLLGTRAFRDLFRTEMIKAREGIGVRVITLLFTHVKGSMALYDRIGDLNAFVLVQQHFDLLQDIITRHDGAVIKTIGDAVMATFLEPADAVAAALAVQNSITEFNSKQPNRAVILKIGIHKGAAIAVTLNDRLDYFGQTVNIAARIQQIADAEEIVISDEVHSDANVQTLLASRRVECSIVKPKGVKRDLHVFRISK